MEHTGGGLETSRGKSRYVQRPGRRRRHQELPSRHASYSTSFSLDQEISREEDEDPVNVHVPALEQTVAQKEEGSGEDDSARHLCLEKCVTLVEKKRVRQFFRLCAVVNVLSLMASGPFQPCRSMRADNRNETGYDCFPQFVTIACVDFVLSVLFTIQLVARLQYAWWQRKTASKVPAPPVPAPAQGGQSGQRYKEQSFTTFIRIFLLTLITFSLWWSVAIGIYRSVTMMPTISRMLRMPMMPRINPGFYLPLIFRSLSIFSAAKLVVQFPYSAGWGLFKTIKWKQLGFVAIYYVFFIYVFALIGVQWIGGLSTRCVFVDDLTNTFVLAIPVTHCRNASVDADVGILSSCFASENSELQCKQFPNGSEPLNIQFRNSLYVGQFRVIVDALLAVYEASSLELWTVMQYIAIEAGERPAYVIVFYFFALVMFLVILVQQSIFLVVIIESFADLRSQTAIGPTSQQKQKNQPHFVLSGSNEIQLQSRQPKRSVEFCRSLQKFYYQKVEKAFLVLVFVDAIVLALKHSGMSDDFACVLRIWQFIASSLFLLEVIGVCVFHILHDQWRLLFTSAYLWYLTVLAVGGMVAAGFYNPLQAPKDFSVLVPLVQSLRLPRLLRLFSAVKKFFLKILGDGTRLFVVILMTLVFLVWFAVINMQLFGYLRPEPDCENFDNQFRGLTNALQSMFQLVMQEGWTDLMSELVCHRSYWLPIMVYVVLLHLFASLILLNFFVAVILDNLEYPEEKKQRKLEQEQQPKRERVPFHLRIFQYCKPKCVPAPKLSSAEPPILTECDVRRFYEVGVTDLSFVGVPSSHSSSNITSNRPQRQSSQIEEPVFSSLINHESADLNPVKGPTNQDKYNSIQSILSHVQAFRQRSREQENSTHRWHSNNHRPQGVSNLATSAASSQFVQISEIDEYREMYHLFDKALFLMPPKHWLRSFCNTILNSQLADPQSNPSFRPRPVQLRMIVKNRVRYIFRYIISRLPYFTWLMLVLTISSISVMIYEYFTSSYPQGNPNNNKPHPTYIWSADLIFIVFTLVELVLKILAHGFFLNPDAAIKSLWDILDWFILLATFVAMVIYLSLCGPAPEVDVGFHSINTGFVIVLCLRALRPLRLVSLVPSMRRVVWDVMLGWKKFLLGAILLVFFIFMFASLGVQLFSADTPKNSPLGFCNDFGRTWSECVGEFQISLYTTGREMLQTDNIPSTTILVPRVWYEQRRDFRFDHTGQAILSLFEVLTLEGWIDVRDMVGNPRNPTHWFLKIYLHVFVFVGVNLGLQLFVGIVVTNFNEHKPDHSALLSVSQKRWTDLMQSIALTQPIKCPPQPKNSRCRQLFYRLVVSKCYHLFITMVIVLHSFTFVVPWTIAEKEIKVAMVFSILFSLYYILELFFKLLAFGPIGYFHSWRNLFDLLLVFLSVAFSLRSLVYLSSGSGSLQTLTDFGLALAVFKLFSLLGKYHTLQDLTVTVGQTFYKSIPLVSVLAAVFLSYSFAGHILFGAVRTGEAINYGYLSFDNIFSVFSLGLRIMTGEDWHQILRDTMVEEPYCTHEAGDCGKTLAAILWFISYYIFVTFIIINVFIAVLLENFSIFYCKGDTRLDHATVKDFQQSWYFFDGKAKGSIPDRRIKLLLRMLKLQDLYTYQTIDSGPRERHLFNALSDPLLLREMVQELKRVSKPTAESGPNGTVLVARNKEEEEKRKEEEEEGRKEEWHSFQNVLRMLSYRAENIHERLEPQELYEREEMEEAVQIEVAECCILNWMQRFVKPVLQLQKRKELLRKQSVHARNKSRVNSINIWATPAVASQPPQTSPTSWVSQDTDEETDMSHTPWHPANHFFSSFSDNEQHTEGTHENPLIQQSYARLAQAPVVYSNGLGKEDKWHTWFKTQREWMDNLDKEDYFDDGL